MRYIFLQCQESSRNVHELSYFSACYLCDPFEGTPPPCFVFLIMQLYFYHPSLFLKFFVGALQVLFHLMDECTNVNPIFFSNVSALHQFSLSREVCFYVLLGWFFAMSLMKKLFHREIDLHQEDFCQFDMSNFSLTSIKITVGINRTITYLMIVFFFSLQNRIHEN